MYEALPRSFRGHILLLLPVFSSIPSVRGPSWAALGVTPEILYLGVKGKGSDWGSRGIVGQALLERNFFVFSLKYQHLALQEQQLSVGWAVHGTSALWVWMGKVWNEAQWSDPLCFKPAFCPRQSGICHLDTRHHF